MTQRGSGLTAAQPPHEQRSSVLLATILVMADVSQIESAPIPSIKSLKSRFEQFALDNSNSSQPSAAVNTQPESTPTPRARPRASLPPPDSPSQPAIGTKRSNPDLKTTALKRAPPPPPPPRAKKPQSSPVVSPLLRPVPAPPALRSPRTSPRQESLTPTVWPDTLSGTDECSEEGSLSSVASLRSIFSPPIQASKSSPTRPMTPRPPPRPPMTSHTDSMMIEQATPAMPPRRTKPGAHDMSRSVSIDVSAGIPLSSTDASPRAGNIATMRGLFASQDATSSCRRDDNSSCTEPTILVSSPPKLPIRPPRPSGSALLPKEDSLDLPGSSNSSIYSPFSDDESEISDISLSPAILRRKTSGSGGAPFLNDTHELPLNQQPSGSSSESLSPAPKPRPPPRPAPHAPPRPPRRPNGLSTPSQSCDSSSVGIIPAQPLPPPLPARRNTQEEIDLEAPPTAPPLPARSSLLECKVTSSASSRKPVGSTRLPPPPTRTIGLGDKLPPVRRGSTSSDEESGSEEDPRARNVESLPDSSRSSRRPPSMPSPNFMEYKMHVPAYSGCIAVSGPCVVVASGHHIKKYDLFANHGPLWTLDTRDTMRGSLITCIEFRSARDQTKRCKFLWIGTKEGHLIEVDVEEGSFGASKMGLHAAQVTHIFRHGLTMITVDEVGKTFVFDPQNAGVGSMEDVNLVYMVPRVYRLGEKADFVKLFGNLLWTALRTDLNGIGTASVPVIRIYDIYAPGSIGRSVTPTQHAGAVTSGTILPTHPDHVYLGHEGGYISIWNVTTGDGIPVCVDVVKVSTSDVLCLEGVNDRLWAGGRKGTISAYDVSSKPWVVTNCWDAHGGLPVSRIFVDAPSLLSRDKFIVVSVGRDEQVRFWDGLLGADRIEQELINREHLFSVFRDLTVLIVTWNVDAAKPDTLTGDPNNVRFLHDVLSSVDGPDIISFGFQEVIDLESRKMAAKTVLLGGKKKGDEGKINEKVTSSYKRWHDRLMQAVKLAMPPDSTYSVIHTESLVGLFTCMFIKNTERASLKDAAIATIKRGMRGRYGNKGGIAARFVIDDSSLCFINCHLAAGQHHVRERNADVAAFLEEPNVFPAESMEEGFAYVGGGDGSMVLDHEIVFLNGDMNYRIDQRREAVVAAIDANDIDSLLTHDQLLKEMKHNRAFRLRSFSEGPLTFVPTYKYDRGSNAFDSSEKRRIPAWCDRVLWRSREAERVALMSYRRWEVNVSDHRPVSAVFRITVKKVLEKKREDEREALSGWWRSAEMSLLNEAREFYFAQAVL